MQEIPQKIVFIAWAFHGRRTEVLSHALGAEDYYIEYLKGKTALLHPLRYLIQSIKTLAILIPRQPDIVITQNPPIFLPLIVYLYSLFTKTKFIIDSHTGAFIGKWSRFIRLHRYLSRKALMTIVTNEGLKEIVDCWRAKAFVLEDKLPDLQINQENNRFERFSICVINSFLEDEPLEEIVEAAKNLPAYDFYITGRISLAPQPILDKKPANVHFTDFLPDREFFKLINKVDGTIVLTTRDLTMLCGAYESVALEKPLITSDWAVLKKYFSKGTLYVDNSPESIMRAVAEMKARQNELSNEMKDLRKQLIPRWEKKFKKLISYL